MEGIFLAKKIGHPPPKTVEAVVEGKKSLVLRSKQGRRRRRNFEVLFPILKRDDVDDDVDGVDDDVDSKKFSIFFKLTEEGRALSKF